MKQLLLLLALALTLPGCATVRESYPSRTATEELLISGAVEDAAKQLHLSIPANRKCFLDSTNFEGTDAKYAISAIREKLMEQGIALMESKDLADCIIEIRTGALSIDSSGRTLIIPIIPLGSLVPGVTSHLTYNQLTHKTDQGIAKFTAFAYDKATGHLIGQAITVVGTTHKGRSTSS